MIGWAFCFDGINNLANFDGLLNIILILHPIPYETRKRFIFFFFLISKADNNFDAF